ncbi:helix-turn-helix domain-containing protein [Streptomyces sp. VRA16 Mangrove soil]|uniref:helix-turn-helix domain-containing protein n=1 Tax=Streptomyces sp. VRA16 Mangrove soil TaxID=2817434 RepID=UPI001A9EB056|nr:helix-turn-helix domain-containing protein [Streptomyces sp. VRA16 Mangrove soil]MBO1333652.1 helix-turn-helix domain-containing protein [Streptomyces sp. VRA16 Mangrove soil]
MDIQHPSAPPHAESGVGGIVHENVRHHSRFTVIGNHLAQHRELSGLAIGLAVYIQSLPAGARADIRTLTARFPEGSTRIAAALRELETHGYLRRERLRTPDGKVRTRTVSCNRPGAVDRAAPAVRTPVREKKPKPLAVPHPERAPGPGLLRAATDVLATLHRADARLALSARDAERLAPGVAAWLERGLTPSAVRHALTRDLPDRPIHRPAALLAHRLTVQLPVWDRPFQPPAAAPPALHPLHNCDVCDRAYRGPEPDRCPGCRAHAADPGRAALPRT